MRGYKTSMDSNFFYPLLWEILSEDGRFLFEAKKNE